MSSNPESSLRDLLYLLTVPNLGPGRIRRLVSAAGSIERLLAAPFQVLAKMTGMSEKRFARLRTAGSWQVADDQLSKAAAADVRIMSIWDDDYPEMLRQIPQAPVILFVKGHLSLQKPRSLAVVGTRRPSHYGRNVTGRLVSDLVDHGFQIVSGLARGIDTIAHQTVVDKHGQTIAVLGCGIDVVYPAENRALFRAIQDNGAIFSEYMMGTGPDAPNFPRRNRIISGLSAGTLVIEAGERSGALITANYALEQNREVFAVPGNIYQAGSIGPNRLIQEGARLVTGIDDILSELGGIATGQQGREERIVRPLPDTLSELERRIAVFLQDEPVHVDALVMQLDLSPASILAALLGLELAGVVTQLPGKMFVKKYLGI